MGKRQNFPKSVQRAALDRSGGICEAIGPLYGHAPNVRCVAKLTKSKNFDHVNGDSNGGKPTLANCAVTCPSCNQHKNNKTDTPRAAKGLRQQDKNRGIKKAKVPIPSRPKPAPVPHTGSKIEAAHRANMAAKNKRIVPRRFT